MIFELSIVDRSHYFGSGYIAGTGNGIVTVNGQPAIRPIYLFEFFACQTPILVAKTFSDSKGRYLFMNLDTTKKYLVMCRDFAPIADEQRFEPAVWDYVAPATDLSMAEQQALWQQMANQASQP